MKWPLRFVLLLSMVLLVTDAKKARPKRIALFKLLALLRRLYSGNIQQTTVPTTPPPGCDYFGTYYPPNTEIYKTEDRDANWCHGAYCDENGQTLTLDDFNCFPTTTPEPTTPPPPTNPPGCQVNGQFFAPGSEISRGEDREANWCFGTFCDDEGNVLHWDNFYCYPTTTPPSTTEPSTTPQTATTQETKRKRKMKFLNRLFRQT